MAEVALSRALNPMNGVSTTFTTLGIAFALAVYAVGSFISSKKAKSPVEQLADANVTHDREAFRACAKRLGMKIGHARRLLREHEKRSRRPPVIPEGDESAGVERIVPKALGVGRARNSTAERKMKRGNNDEKASNTKSKSSVARLEDWVSTHFRSADDPKTIAKCLIRGFLKEFRGVARPFDFSPVAWALNRIEAKQTESIMLALKKAGIDTIPIITGAAFMTFLAAFVEGFWSGTPWLNNEIKYTVGILSWIAVFSYLLASGRKQ